MSNKKTSLVWANLLHQKVRTIVGVTGITLAVVLLFLQLGFLGSADANASLIYNQMDFDLLLLSSDYVELSRSGSFTEQRLARVLSEAAVVRAVPVYIAFPFWSAGESTAAVLNKRQIMLLAFPAEEPVFRLPEVVKEQRQLQIPGTVLFDRRSRPAFGVPQGPLSQLADKQLWVGRHPVQIVGKLSLGAGFTADGLILSSERTFAQLMDRSDLTGAVNLGLIKLGSGADARQVADSLNARLGAGVHVWPREEIIEHEKRYWKESTAIGVTFKCGAAVAVMVGIVFVYQVISSDIASRIREFATLKALGFGDSYLAATVLWQAVLLALFGYVPGLVLAFVLYAIAAHFAAIPIGLAGEPLLVLLERCLLVLCLTVGLCSVSGLAALGKLKTADPADLY